MMVAASFPRTMIAAMACAALGCGGRSPLPDDFIRNTSDGAGGAPAGLGGAPGGVGGTSGSMGGALSGGGKTPQGGGGASSQMGSAIASQMSSATGGGSGGAPVDAGHSCGQLIDDMEDGSGFICEGEGRVGAWYAYNDGFGIQSPAPTRAGVPIPTALIPGGRGSSTRGIHSSYAYSDAEMTNRNSYDTWGAGVGVDLDFDGRTYGLYDASAYDGIEFWARGSGSYFEVRVSTAETTRTIYGGTCEMMYCQPHTSQQFMTPAWKLYRVAFADLHPEGAFPTPPFRKNRLTNIQFLFIAFNYPNDDFWLDDLSFYVGP